MSDPTPAQPIEGAGFYRFCDVPDGWEFRWSQSGEWYVKDRLHPGEDSDLCEARPKPEPLVAVMLPKDTVRSLAFDGGHGRDEHELMMAARIALKDDE